MPRRMTGTNADSADEPTGNEGALSLAGQASRLWALATDRSRWGFVEEAARLRELATAKRVQAVLADSMRGDPAA
jgi:hypothetical protein